MKTFIRCAIVPILVFFGLASAGAQETPHSIYEILKKRNSRFHRLGYDFSGQRIPKGTLTVRLHAVDADNGQTVEDFSVTFLQGDVEEYRFNNEVVVLCGEEAVCEVGTLFPRAYTMNIAAPGYELARQVVDVPAEEGGVIRVSLTPATGTVEGRVYDKSSHQPVSGAVVSLLDNGAGVKSCRTDKEGYFALKGLRVHSAGKVYALVCDSPNHFSKEVHFSFDGTASAERDVYLDFAPSVDGELLDEEDNPLANEEVFLLSKHLYEAWQRSIAWDPNDPSFIQSTNKLGRFRFEKLPPGRYVLVYGGDLNDVAEVELEGMDQLKVQLKRTSGGAL